MVVVFCRLSLHKNKQQHPPLPSPPHPSHHPLTSPELGISKGEGIVELDDGVGLLSESLEVCLGLMEGGGSLGGSVGGERRGGSEESGEESELHF